MFNNYSPKIDIKEFILIFPNIISNIEKENTHKFLKYFNKPKNKEFEYQESNLFYPIRSKSHILKNKNNHYIINIKIKKRRSFNKVNKLMILNVFDNHKFEKEKDSIILNSNDIKNNKNIIVEREGDEADEYYLIKKGIFLQNNTIERTDDVKTALLNFFYNSKYIEKLSKNIKTLEIKNSKKLFSEKKYNIYDSTIKYKINNKLNNIISKLSEKVILKNYLKNDFIIKRNERGDECYFLLSGKISVLRPVEYSGIKITYKEYFLYLKNLLNYNETNLILKVLSINRKFLNITTIDEISRLIRGYFVLLLKRELDKKSQGITIKEIESYFKSFYFSFEDINLNKNKILGEIKKMQLTYANPKKLLRNYILEYTSNYMEDILLVDKYNVLNDESEKKAGLVTLYKYENFLYLYPGWIFGDISLDSKLKKRNATVRAEEDCIVCSLSNENYISILAEDNKKIKALDLIFLCNNFFFNRISPVVFNKSYYHLFREIELDKNDIIYSQDSEFSSIYFVKEGEIKMEYEGNIHNLYELNKYIFDELYSRINNFKITMDQLEELKDNYLSNKNLKKEKNKEFLSEMNKKSKFELFSSNGYECTGVLEFYFNRKYLTTCTVISKKAVLMELKKEHLSKIFKKEGEILPSFYKLIFIKLISLIKRLHYLKKNSICQMKDKFKENTFDNYYKNELNINSTKDINNFHKKRFEFLNPVKIKNIYHEKKNVFDNHNKKNVINNPFTVTNKSLIQIKNNNFSTKSLSSLHQMYHHSSQKLFKILNNSKSISSKNKKELFNSTSNITKKDLILSAPKYYLRPNSFSKTNKSKKKILYKKNIGNTPIEKNKIKSDIILTKKGYISIYNIKKNLLKRNEESKTFENFKFINRLIYSYDDEKSFQDENSCKRTKNNKNNKNNNIIKFDRITIKRNDCNGLNMSKEDLDNNITATYDFPKKMSKSTQSIKTKDAFAFNNSKINKKFESSFAKKENSNFVISSLPSIKKKNKKIINLIGEMKKKYAISLGKKKFIYYRSPKKNKAINLVDEQKNCTSTKKSIGQTIKDYYLKKKIEGYSSLINPLNNTYINRQRTYKIYKS